VRFWREDSGKKGGKVLGGRQASVRVKGGVGKELLGPSRGKEKSKQEEKEEMPKKGPTTIAAVKGGRKKGFTGE